MQKPNVKGMHTLKKLGIVFSSTVLAAACASGNEETQSYQAVPGDGTASSSVPAQSGNERESGNTDAGSQSSAPEETTANPESLLASMSETDTGPFTANGNHQGAGTHFRTTDGAINCLVNAMNQFCFFEDTHDPSQLDGAEEILCEASRDGQPHSADIYIGWNPSNGMGDPGTEPGLCQLDGGFPWRGGASAELPSGEKMSILVGFDTRDTVECGNDDDTIICEYRGHGFTASATEVSVW